LAAHPVDGIIFMSTSARQDNRHLAHGGAIPMAVINRYGVNRRLIRILWDDRAGARTAVQHLAELGHRRIGLIGGPRGRLSATRRLQGYTAAHRAAGVAVDPRLIVGGDYTVEAGLSGVRQLLKLSPPPSAIVAANDTMAMGALRGIHAAGLRCPDDVAVVGIGDPPFMAFAAPPLTTVALPVEAAGRRAAERLLERIRGGATSSYVERLPCTLKVRESSGAAGEDRRTARQVDDV